MEKLNLIAVLFFCYQRFDLAHLGPNQFPFIYCFYYKILKRGLVALLSADGGNL
jgi:hypothetical protein